jgi:hypothetical protein
MVLFLGTSIDVNKNKGGGYAKLATKNAISFTLGFPYNVKNR